MILQTISRHSHPIPWFFLLASTVLALLRLELPAQDAPPTGIDPKAADVMRAVAAHYQGLKSVSARVTVGMKIEMQGMKTEMDSAYDFAAQRPNRLALISRATGIGAMMAGTVVSDGTNVHLHMPMMNQYSSETAPASLGEVLEAGNLVTMQSGPGMMFLAALVDDQPYEKLMKGVTGGSHAGRETVGEIECHHLRFQQPQLDWDIWVAVGPEPKVVKIVPDMSKTFAELSKSDLELPEQMPKLDQMKMEFTVGFKEWTFNPELPASRFVFTPPEGAKKVDDLLAALGGGGGGDHALLGKPAPALELELLGGGGLDLGKHKGKDVVVLDFWATWCGPCVKGLPIVTEVTGMFKDRGVVFYAVNQGEDSATIKPFLEEHKLAIPVALDPDSKAGEAYAVEGIPQTVLISKDGTVEAVHVGLLPNLKSKLQAELEKLVAGKKLAAE